MKQESCQYGEPGPKMGGIFLWNGPVRERKGKNGRLLMNSIMPVCHLRSNGNYDAMV